MSDGSSVETSADLAADARTERALAALLAIDAGSAADVRADSPPRRRSHGQYGPCLDLGGDGNLGSGADAS